MRGRGVYKILYVVFALGTAHLLMLCGVEAQRWLAQKQELKLVEAQTKALAREVAGMREELRRADDPAYMEEMARSLGYVYPNEELYAKPR
ncbi:septum formation initiator family protein [Oceanithermus sp.]